MGFAVGSSFNSPIYYSLFSIPPTQPISHCNFLNFPKRNAAKKRKKMTAIARLQNGDNNNFDLFKKRAILFMGISILPILKLRGEALEDLAVALVSALKLGVAGLVLDLLSREEPQRNTKDSELLTQKQKENAKQTQQGDTSPNLFLFLLNGIGIFGSSVFGVLFALSQKEKARTEETMKSMKIKLHEKEAAMVSLRQKCELQVRDEREERNKQVKIANEEKQSLINQLQSANSTITGLGRELTKEKRVVEGFKVQIDSLTTELEKAEQDKKELEDKLKEKLNLVEVLQESIDSLNLEINDKEVKIRDISSRLDDKELEFNKLSSIHEKTKYEAVGLNSDIEALKGDLIKLENEIGLKNAEIDDLNAQVSSLIAERDEFDRKLGIVEKEFDDLKFSAEKKAVSDAKLLEDRANELHQLKEQLVLAVDEVSKKKVLVADLSQERDDLRSDLDKELKAISSLEQELLLAQDTLEKSRNEVFDQAKEMEQSRNLCLQLTAEISKVQAESADAMESLQRYLAEARQSAEAKAAELISTKEILNQLNEQMETMSSELTNVLEDRDSLQKELIDVYKKAETAINDLKEEKEIVTSLNKELRALESQILNDKEARASLETDLEEATKSLDEMNRNALTLSKDLELANSKISSLQDDKDLYYRSLTEQKQISQEAKENMEDAHNLVMKLGKEREKLEKKAKKLEEAAASAKGEILRLRSQIKSLEASTNNKPKVAKRENTVDKQKVSNVDMQKGVDEATVPVKKTSRRRKVVSKKES